MTEKKLKYVFGTSDTHCEADFFDTIEEVIEYAQASWDDKDGGLNMKPEDKEVPGRKITKEYWADGEWHYEHKTFHK